MCHKQPRLNRTKISTINNGPWFIADVQAHIDRPPIPLINIYLEELHATNIINVKIWRKPSQATSETYKANMFKFDNVQLEEFLELLRNFIIAIDGTRTTFPSVRINYLHTMLHWASLREFEKLAL